MPPELVIARSKRTIVYIAWKQLHMDACTEPTNIHVEAHNPCRPIVILRSAHMCFTVRPLLVYYGTECHETRHSNIRTSDTPSLSDAITHPSTYFCSF